jgi:hypothetical protein
MSAPSQLEFLVGLDCSWCRTRAARAVGAPGESNARRKNADTVGGLKLRNAAALQPLPSSFTEFLFSSANL